MLAASSPATSTLPSFSSGLCSGEEPQSSCRWCTGRSWPRGRRSCRSILQQAALGCGATDQQCNEVASTRWTSWNSVHIIRYASQLPASAAPTNAYIVLMLSGQESRPSAACVPLQSCCPPRVNLLQKNRRADSPPIARTRPPPRLTSRNLLRSGTSRVVLPLVQLDVSDRRAAPGKLDGSSPKNPPTDRASCAVVGTHER